MTTREISPPYIRSDSRAFYVRYDPEIPITVPEVKIENCLLKYKDQCENNQLWITAFGIFITILFAWISSTPHDLYLIHASTLEGFTLVVLIFTGLATIYYFKKYYKKIELSDIIGCIKRF